MRTALITGAGTRIGRHFALGLAQDGWAIAIHYNRSEGAAQNLSDAVRAAGSHAAIVPGNLNVPKERDTVVSRAATALGHPITALINNASTFTPDTGHDFTSASLDHHLNINLTAPLCLARDFAAQIPAPAVRNSARPIQQSPVKSPVITPVIINLLDQRLLNPAPDYFTYSVSKSALKWATITMAQTFAPTIRVNGISPGPTLRNVHQTVEEFEAECRSTLLRRGSPPDTLLGALRYLLSAESVTGQILTVDGGQHLVPAPISRSPHA